MFQVLFSSLFCLLTGITVAGSVKVIRQGDQALVEFLGKYEGKKLEPGLTLLIPVFEQVAYKQTLREQILELPPKQYTTRDFISVTVNIVVYWRVTDLEKASYKVQNLKSAMLNLLFSKIRNEIAKFDVDELFTARQEINEVMVEELDVATEPWGVKVTRVELQDFTIGNKVFYPGENSNYQSQLRAKTGSPLIKGGNIA